LSDTIFYQQTDRLLLGIVAGAVAVGLYEAAAKFNVLVTYLSGLSVSAVLPLASSMGAEGRHASLRALFMRGTKYTAALVAPVSVGLIVFAEPLLRAWLGDLFAEQAIVAQVLVFPHVLVSLGLMGDAIVTSQGRLKKRVPYILAQAILNVVLSLMLIPRFGVLGVALGTALAHLIDFPLHIRWLLKETRVSLAEWMREVIAPVYPLLLVPLVLGSILARSPVSATVLGIFMAGIVTVGAYWLALYFVGLSEWEREEARVALRAARARIIVAGRS
jgi:O-antigen/teichoic acid export membrane protein